MSIQTVEVKEVFSTKKVTMTQLRELAVAEFLPAIKDPSPEQINEVVEKYIARGGYKQVFKEVKNSEGTKLEPVVSPSTKEPLYERTVGLEATILNPAPALVAQLGELGEKAKTLLTRSIYGTIREFVRAQYIDRFLEVGAHSLDFIAEEMAKSGRAIGSATIKLRQKDFKFTTQLFEAWFGAPLDATGRTRSPAQIAAFTEAADSKFTLAGVTKALGPDNAKPEVLNRIIGIVGAFGNPETLSVFDVEEDQLDAAAEVALVWIENLKTAIHELENPKEVDRLEGI